jgi:Zn-dependent protease
MDHDPAPFAGPPPSYPPAGGPNEGSGPPMPPVAGFVSQVAVHTPPMAMGMAEAPSPPPLSAPPRGRRIALPIILFGLTCGSTFFVGVAMFATGIDAMIKSGLSVLEIIQSVFANHWDEGATYMVAVMSILLAHEMGHFLQALRYRVPASLPYFIPMPISPIGTMGAVIGMRGLQADRKQLFDIGLSGPWAGLVLAIPISWVGIATAEPIPASLPLSESDALVFHDPLLFKLLMTHVRADVPHQEFFLNPLLLAGWVGMLITGLNMLPISQLDGGHVAYALLGKHAHWLAKGVAIAAAIFILVAQQYGWVLMLLLVLVIGVNHPPTANDNVKLGWPRWIVGMVSLIIPIMCLAPIPIS